MQPMREGLAAEGMATVQDGPAAESGAGAKSAAPVHWSWHLLLLLAAGMVVTSLMLDPAAAETDLVRGQLTILRGALFVFAAGAVGVWFMRGMLSEDLLGAFARWRSAPSDLQARDLIHEPASPRITGLLWAGALAWFAAVFGGLASASEWLHRLTFENGPLETLTVIAYVVAAVFALLGFRQSTGEGRKPGLRRWVLLVAAAGAFLIAAEETDWGQVYLQYETPESFEAANIQQDLSLHNLAPPGIVPGTRWANWVLRGLGFGLGGIVPLLVYTVPLFRRWMWAWQIPIPPFVCQCLLFVSAFIPEAADLYHRNNVGSEIREVTIAVAVVLWMWTAHRTGDERAEA